MCRAEPNTVMIHCRMLDSTAQLQQEALGILGVNLVHGSLSKAGSHYQVLAGLMDDLSRARIEVQRCTTMALQTMQSAYQGLISFARTVRHLLSALLSASRVLLLCRLCQPSKISSGVTDTAMCMQHLSRISHSNNISCPVQTTLKARQRNSDREKCLNKRMSKSKQQSFDLPNV